MRVYTKLIFLGVLVVTLNSCEESMQSPPFNPQQYGESQVASQDFVDDLNRVQRQSSFPSSGEGMSRWVNNQVSGPTSGMCVDTTEVDSGADYSAVMSDEEKEFLEKEVGDPPSPGGPVQTQLPAVNAQSQDVYKYGYYRYKDSDQKVYGTERTIWRIKAAGKLLAQKGIVMGIGDISSRGGRTRGHAEHQGGQDVDLRLINDNGVATPCTVGNSSCYNREKTFTMIKTLIDVDPTKVDKVLINDPVLRRQINNYYQLKTGSSRGIASACASHDNHVHFSWKRR
ncbi:penicillin-insensitive murein endopeptidase [Bacteriovoracaceae bacterium]|nr:penicillin-insensitive murein endopeptidase [Bacteriovoracaceae bacterium]